MQRVREGLFAQLQCFKMFRQARIPSSSSARPGRVSIFSHLSLLAESSLLPFLNGSSFASSIPVGSSVPRPVPALHTSGENALMPPYSTAMNDLGADAPDLVDVEEWFSMNFG